MRTIKILALSALLVAATAAVSFAGEGCEAHAGAKAETAQASATCIGAATAQATAACCVDAAAAGASCNHETEAATAVHLETVRMPSGALAVFYHGDTAESVNFLQASAANGCSGFVCELAKSVAADENCTVEMVKTETGAMMLVTADKSDVVDGYEAKYAAAIASMSKTSETTDSSESE